MDSLIARADAIQPVSQRRKHDLHARSRSKLAPKPRPGPSSKATPRKDADDSKSKSVDHTAASITQTTLPPRSLRPRPDSPPPPETNQHKHIKNPTLRRKLVHQSEHSARAKALVHDVAFVDEAIGAPTGQIEVEGELERTWRVSQADIVKEAGAEAAKGRREWKLDGGPYRVRYTRNGRHMAIVGKLGHVASFDWQAGTMHAELQLKETCRDITYLHDQSHFAVAQKKYVYIYDMNGVELHRLSDHIEPTRLEFLPYHWLLVSIGNTGHLKYQDTSTGQLVASHRTALGPCSTLTQNPHTAVVYLGHANGTVTLWTPNMPQPVVRLQAHLGPVTGLAVDASANSIGRYLATSGLDGSVKVWDCRNWKGVVREWRVRAGPGGGAEVDWSAKGYLAVAAGGSVNVYTPPTIYTPPPGQTSSTPAPIQPPLYLTHPIPHRPLTSPRFVPFTDVLTVGHANGLSSILVPGAGEPRFDSSEADPFEGRRMRREREVHALMDKIQPDMITLDTNVVGALAPQATTLQDDELPRGTSFARLPRLDRLRVSGKADETEVEGAIGDGEEDGEDGDGETGGTSAAAMGKGKQDREKRAKQKMRGKGKSIKRYLRKQRKNVIDPTTIAIRTKLEKQREERRKELAAKRGQPEAERPKSALDRFKR